MLPPLYQSKIVIAVSGLPGTGKTTLSKQIADAYSVPLISKDVFKESLFDSLGVGDREWSSRLGAASFDLMFVAARELMQGKNAFLFEAHFSSRAFSTLETLVEEFQYQLVTLNCHCLADVALNRFRQRWHSGKRHRGHVDDQNFAALEESFRKMVPPLTSSAGALLQVDTTTPEEIDFNSILNFVASHVQK